jgi:nitrite reductase/ring-hydroxylating ferredoxin subunit
MTEVGRAAPREYVVGRVEDLPPGSVTIIPLGKFGVGVFNVNGAFYALVNYCLHRGAPMCRGVVCGLAEAGEQPYEVVWGREGEVLRCPWHGWEFDITTGRSFAFPDKRIRTYPVAVRDGVVIVSTS